jgi:hypothetical protein
MRSHTFSPTRCFAVVAAPLVFHWVLMAQVTAYSYLTPTSGILDYSRYDCSPNATPGTSIPFSLSMDYACYDPKAPPQSEISPGVSVPFTYSATSWGRLVASVNGVCMSDYPAITNSTYLVSPSNATSQQPSGLDLRSSRESQVILAPER